MTDCEKWVWTGVEIPGLQDNSFQRAGKFDIQPTLPAAMGMGGLHTVFSYGKFQ